MKTISFSNIDGFMRKCSSLLECFCSGLQTRGLRNLVARNERLYHGTDSIPAGGVALPFILVQVLDILILQFICVQEFLL